MNTPPIETYERNGYRVDIYPDHDPVDSPRDWDNVGTMLCAHGRYELGDEQLAADDFSGWQSVVQHLKRDRAAVIVLPLYLYDHSGISISTGDFTDPWDSGQVGYIYADRDAILEALGGKKITAAKLKRAEQILRNEVATYDQYLTGDVYGYTVTDPHGHDLDSCWGFYGMKYAKEEANAAVDYDLKHPEQRAARLDRKIEEAKQQVTKLKAERAKVTK